MLDRITPIRKRAVDVDCRAFRELLALGAILSYGFCAEFARGDGSDLLHSTATLETWIYAESNSLRSDSVLNPNNVVARLPNREALFDARLTAHADDGPIEALVSPRFLEAKNWVTEGDDSTSDTFSGSGKLTQSFFRLKFDDNAFTVGRELWTWGPGTFRSPSNPFYFDAGRTNPLAATPGIDLARDTVSLGTLRLTAGYVLATNQISPSESLGHSALLKMDQQGVDYLASIVADVRSSGSSFFGAFSQWTVNDAALVYAEVGSSNQQKEFMPMVPEPAFARVLTSLVGASYTMQQGEVLTGEYLYNNGGYTRSEESRYFQQALSSPPGDLIESVTEYNAPGLVLSHAPRLLGRGYIWLGLQGSPQNSKSYWRVELAENLGDHSGQAVFYLERKIILRMSSFMALTVNSGSVRSDFGNLTSTGLAIGIKLFPF